MESMQQVWGCFDSKHVTLAPHERVCFCIHRNPQFSASLPAASHAGASSAAVALAASRQLRGWQAEIT